MCIGEPMRILKVEGESGLCEGVKGETTVDLRLVPDAGVGDHILVFLGAARRQITPQEAGDMRDALEALQAAASGASLDAFFSDLATREPALPAHMEAARRKGLTEI